MPSPFPGMDPFLEGQLWRDFHSAFLAVVREMLMPRVRPRYVVEIQEYVYLAREGEAPDRLMEPDLALVESGVEAEAAWRGPAATASTLAPVIHTVPVPRRYRQTFLTIRERQWRDVVTVLELLSPGNKETGEERTEYLVKRNNVFCTPAHLVELDLLRGGQRLPTREPLAAADYYAFVCRKERLPQVEVYAWTLHQPLPAIPIPLAGEDPDVLLDLQAAFTVTHDRAGYDYALDYRRPVEPLMEPSEVAWIRSVLGRPSSDSDSARPG